VKSRAQLSGELDLLTTQDKSALQPSAAGHPDSLRSSPAKKIATSTAPLDSGHEGHSVSGIVDAVLEIGSQRNALPTQLRAALESGKEKEALNFARRLCGL
jgi:hypothetical protein